MLTCDFETASKGSNFIKIEESLSGPFSMSDLCISLASPIRRRPIQQRAVPLSPYSVALPHCERHVGIDRPVADCSLVKDRGIKIFIMSDLYAHEISEIIPE